MHYWFPLWWKFALSHWYQYVCRYVLQWLNNIYWIKELAFLYNSKKYLCNFSSLCFCFLLECLDDTHCAHHCHLHNHVCVGKFSIIHNKQYWDIYRLQTRMQSFYRIHVFSEHAKIFEGYGYLINNSRLSRYQIST